MNSSDPLSLLLSDPSPSSLSPSLSSISSLLSSYLSSSLLPSSLSLSLQTLLQNPIIPKNPYFKLIRDLRGRVSQKSIIEGFDDLLRKFQISEVNEDQTNFGLVKVGGGWGTSCLMEWVDSGRMGEVVGAVGEVGVEIERKGQDFEMMVCHSFGGAHFLKSGLLDFPESAKKPLEIGAEVFVEGESANVGFEAFASFVYDDVLSLTNIKDLHLFMNFAVCRWNPETKQLLKTKWELSNIIKNKAKFVNKLVDAVQKKQLIYMKILLKGKRIDFNELIESAQSKFKMPKSKENYFASKDLETKHQYFLTYKYYNFHFTNTLKKSKTSYEYQPLSSLLKRFFISFDNAVEYASFFYQRNERFFLCSGYETFIQKQLIYLFKDWSKQSMLDCAWDTFYLAILVQKETLKKELMDNILQILSSYLAGYMAFANINKKIITLLKGYSSSTLPFFREMCITEYEILKTNLEKLLSFSRNAEILKSRPYILSILKDLLDLNTDTLKIEGKSSIILKNLYRTIKSITESELYLVSLFMSGFPFYIRETLRKNNLLDGTNQDLLTYEAFLASKQPRFILNMAEEKKEILNSKIIRSKDDKKLEQAVLITYINEYEIFETLYIFFRETFFGPQYPNPYPYILLKFESQAMKFDLFEMQESSIKELLFNDESEIEEVFVGNKKIKGLYSFRNKQMENLGVPTIYGRQKIVKIASALEAGSLQLYFTNFDWKNALSKNPPSNYEIIDIFSVSSQNLISNATVLKRTYVEWFACWDFVFKGTNFQNATQIFLFILITYSLWLQKTTEIDVIGFFLEDSDSNAALPIEFVLTNEENNRPREALSKLFQTQQRVYLKMIAKLEDRFKNINIFFNLHFIDSSSSSTSIQHLTSKTTIDEYLKIFFKPEDFLLHERLYKEIAENMTNLFEKEITRLHNYGNLNLAVKLSYMKLMLEESEIIAITVGRFFFSIAEGMYNFAKEAETLAFIFRVLKNIQESNQKEENPKLSIGLVKTFYSSFKNMLRHLLSQYNNCYLEGQGMLIVYYLNEIDYVFSRNDNFKAVVHQFMRIKEELLSIYTNMFFTFKKVLLDELDYKLL